MWIRSLASRSFSALILASVWLFRRFRPRTDAAIVADQLGERSHRDASPEWCDAGAASKTRRAAKGDPAVDGQVAAEA